MARRVAIAGTLAVMVLFAVGGLRRAAAWFPAVRRTTAASRPPRRRRAAPAPPGRKIKARLFYVSDDGDAADQRRARRRLRRRRRRSGARDHRRADRAGRRAARVGRTARHDAARACSSPKRATPTSTSAARSRSAHPGGTAQRAADGLHDRQRAHRQPAGGHRRAAAGRRQGGRHAVGPRRSAAAAREESGVGTDTSTCDLINDRPTSSATPRSLPTTLMHAEGSVLIERRPDQGDLHRERRGSRAAVPAQHRQGLGDRGVRHAAARDEHAHAARGDGRQGRRPDPGDPAADRPLAALGDQPAGARRAHDLDRLRRDPGRRRHADGVDHRRVRRAGAGAREAARARRPQDDPAAPTTSPRSASASSTASRCSTWRTRTTAAPTST